MFHPLIASLFFLSLSLFAVAEDAPQPPRDDSWKLVWAEEFNKEGEPDPKRWGYETGFCRNNEDQWYQKENAFCKGGFLILEARKETKEIPKKGDFYIHPSFKKRTSIEYTSASLITKQPHSWTFGRFELRARFPAQEGLWPAWWTTGKGRWPHGGEIDMMEYYDNCILANTAWAGKYGKDEWDTTKTPLEKFNDPKWSEKFHHWVMEWTPKHIKIWLDGRLLNETDLSKTVNEDGLRINPFHQAQIMRLNLAIGGNHGGDPRKVTYPVRYEIDWVRIYQKDPSPVKPKPAEPSLK